MTCNGAVHVSERREDQVKEENKGFHILQLHDACFYLCCKAVKTLGFAMMSCWWGPSNV